MINMSCYLNIYLFDKDELKVRLTKNILTYNIGYYIFYHKFKYKLK